MFCSMRREWTQRNDCTLPALTHLLRLFILSDPVKAVMIQVFLRFCNACFVGVLGPEDMKDSQCHAALATCIGVSSTNSKAVVDDQISIILSTGILVSTVSQPS